MVAMVPKIALVTRAEGDHMARVHYSFSASTSKQLHPSSPPEEKQLLAKLRSKMKSTWLTPPTSSTRTFIVKADGV